MTLLSLLITFGIIWLNLTGLSLLANYAIKDYAVSRIGAPLLLCLVFFFIEHFYGLGPQLWLLPFSAAISGWLVWKERRMLRQNIEVEASFAAGFLYCMVWRYSFPDIDLDGEKIPDLVFINNYIVGTKLPPIDRWLPPFKMDFYYSFQHYSGALLGRWFQLGPTFSYQFAFCVIAGLITTAIYTASRRFCPWKPGAWIILGALLFGGCGLGLEANLSMNHYIQPAEICRYLGLHRPAQERTAVGRYLDSKMYPSGKDPQELPVTPLSFLVALGEYHPPIAGFLVLSFSALLIASLEIEGNPTRRTILVALLAATLPISLISNSWDFPLQVVLVGGWFAYRFLKGEWPLWKAGLIDGGIATILSYPFLVGFMQQALAHSTEIRHVRSGDHSWIGWFLVFWPVLGLIVLAPLNKERRALVLYLASVWLILTVGTEEFYMHDVNGGTWERYNSTLKWWGWIYAGGVLLIGGPNLASKNRFCRFGSLLLILLPCAEVYNYARFFYGTNKPSLGQIDGTYWITADVNYRSIINSLKARPDGICIDSGNQLSNTDSTVMGLFANKQALVGWPIQETIWRDQQTDIVERLKQVESFYMGKMDDPLAWLLANKIRYVLWLQKDNGDQNSRFLPLRHKIESRYIWHRFYGNDSDWSLGYWEYKDDPVSR
jgi:hypothetical protein